jgi:hypothetical protein
MTKAVKHGIFIVSLFASIGMLVFSHYAYAVSEQQFGAWIVQDQMPPIQCQGGRGPFTQRSGGKTYQPTGLTSTDGSTQISGGTLRSGKWVLGFYSTRPATHCYVQIGPYRYTVNTTVFTRIQVGRDNLFR